MISASLNLEAILGSVIATVTGVVGHVLDMAGGLVNALLGVVTGVL